MPMYQVKPTSGGDARIDLPTCMYKLPNVHAQTSSLTEHAHQNGGLDPALRALEARQDDIMRKLYELKAAVDGLAKAATTPDVDVDTTRLPSTPVPAVLSSPTLPTKFPFRAPADLDVLLGKGQGTLRDIVINARPSQPPLSLLVLHGLLCQRYRVLSSVHVHSSAPGVAPALLSCLGPPHTQSASRQSFQLGFTLIWKDVPKLQMKFRVQNMCPIEGEANVARFLFRLLTFEPDDPAIATLVDCWVDRAFFQLAGGSTKERFAVLKAMNEALGRGEWLVGSELSLADIVCACCLLQSGSVSSTPPSVRRWLKACENLGFFGPAHTLLQ